MNKRDNNENRQSGKNGLKRFAGVSLGVLLAGSVAMSSMAGAATKNPEESAAKIQLTTSSDAAEDTAGDAAQTESTTVKGGLDVTDIVEKAMPSVVSITTKSVQEVQSMYDLYGFFGGYGYGSDSSTQQEVEGSGSGIIVGYDDQNSKLLIVTNFHVVDGANDVTVSFADGESYGASIRGLDEANDLAIVAVSLDDLTEDTKSSIQVATIGSSDDLKVGEQVVAIGNALGYGQSVTTGIVSAKNIKLDDYANLVDSSNADAVNLIQTDAAINPGNSGGALLNMNGEVVGINSSKLAATTVEGMGYAIAISDVSTIIENLMNEEPRETLADGEHGALGISVSTVTSDVQTYYGIPTGVYVNEVNEGSAAQAAGIKSGDVITYFGTHRVTSSEDLISYVKKYAPGEEIELTIMVMSDNGYTEKTVNVTMGEDTVDYSSASDTESDSQSQDQSEAFQDTNPQDGSQGSVDEGDQNFLDQYGNGGYFGNWFY